MNLIAAAMVSSICLIATSISIYLDYKAKK